MFFCLAACWPCKTTFKGALFWSTWSSLFQSWVENGANTSESFEPNSKYTKAKTVQIAFNHKKRAISQTLMQKTAQKNGETEITFQDACL